MKTAKKPLLAAVFLESVSSTGTSAACCETHPTRFMLKDCRVTLTYKLQGTIAFERTDPEAPRWQQMTCPEGIL